MTVGLYWLFWKLVGWPVLIAINVAAAWCAWNIIGILEDE